MRRLCTVIGFGLAALSITFGQSQPYNVVQPDALSWQAGDIFPHGAEMASIAGDPHHPGDFTMRIRTTGNYHVQPYSHPEFENITVLSGTLHVGFGSVISAANEQVLQSGGFISITPGTLHYWWTDGPTVTQWHGNGCLQVIYVSGSAPVAQCQ